MLIILQNFVKLAFPEVAFPENRLFERFGTFRTNNLQTRWVISKLISCLLMVLDICWKFRGHTSSSPRDLNVVSTPQMPVSCQKEQMLLTVKIFTKIKKKWEDPNTVQRKINKRLLYLAHSKGLIWNSIFNVYWTDRRKSLADDSGSIPSS